MSSSGGVPSFPPIVISKAGIVVEGRVGIVNGRVKGGKEFSFKRMHDSVFGPKGPCFGPNGLVNWVTQGPFKESGEIQGPFKEIQEGLGQDSRPIDPYVVKGCREGEKGMGRGLEGLDAVDGGVLIGEGSSASRPRAQTLSLERGVNGDADPLVLGEEPSASRPRAQTISMERGINGDDDPIVGMRRVVMPMEVSKVVKRGTMTDEALHVEASKYVENSLLSVWGWELSSSTLSFGFDRAGAKEGALSGLVSMIEGEEQLPMSIILADGSNGELGSEGEKSSSGEGGGGGGGEFEDLLQDLEGKGCR